MRAAGSCLVCCLAVACGSSPAPSETDASTSSPDGTTVDAAVIAPPSYGERCGGTSGPTSGVPTDDDGDGLVDEDCPPSLFGGIYAPGVSGDPMLAAIEGASGRPFAVLQTYHSTSPLGVSRTPPDLAAIFARGQVAHLNVEPADYARTAYAAPTADPIASDLRAMGEAIASALADAPAGRVLLTFGAEMNGAWTDWGCLSSTHYIALYRAAHATFNAALDARGIDRRRVRWVWGPDSRGSASCAPAAAYYPGHAYVDAIGLSAYRKDTESVATTVVQPMAQLFDALDYPAAWRRDRFIVLQTGSRAVAGRDAFIEGLFATLAADERAAGIIYFDAAEWAIAEAGTGWTGLVTALRDAPIADRALEGTFAPHFWDVAYADAGFAEIQALADANVTTGCGSAPPRFCPNDLLDRRTAAILLARAFALPPGDGPPSFVDVPATDAGFGAVEALVARGALSGCGNARFCPDEPITEAQLASVLGALGAHPSELPEPSSTMAIRARAAMFIARGARLGPAPL